MSPNLSNLPPTPTSIRSISSSPTSDDDHSSSSQLLESSDYVQVFSSPHSDHPNSPELNPSTIRLKVNSIDSESDRDAWLDLSNPVSQAGHHSSSFIEHDPLPDHRFRIPWTSDISPPSLIQSPIDHHPSPEQGHHLSPEQRHHRPFPGPQLDLSCVNSDDTEASLTSLFSFPDPLNSVDQVLPSDHYDPAWFARYDNNDTASLPSPRSDHHSNFSSDHQDFRSSPSPSLTDGDLQSHSSASSPTLPVFPRAGSDLSHTLHVYLCGNQVSQSQLGEIVFNLRLNFSHIDLLKLNYSSSLRRGPSEWQWSHFTRHRFRNAVSSALLKSSPSPFSISNRDLMYETSWLEIISSDLTSLSESRQHCLLSSLPEKPALIIYTFGSSDCFPTRWLKELSQACPALIHFSKLLPVVLDEKKTLSQILIDSFRALYGSNTTCTVKSSTPACVTADSLPFELFLEDTSNSMDHRCLRPCDLGLLSAPSVSKLHRLLMPFERSSQPVGSTTSWATSKLLALLACLLAIVAASFMIRSFDMDVTHPTQSLMKVTKSPLFHLADGQAHELSGVSRALSTWNSSVAITPPGFTPPKQPVKDEETARTSAMDAVDSVSSNLQVPRESSNAATFAPALDKKNEFTLSSHLHETLSVADSTEPEIGSANHVFDSKHSPLMKVPKFRSRSSKPAKSKESTNSRDSISMTRNISNIIHHLNTKDQSIINLFIRSRPSNRTVTKTMLKDWGRQLPKRLRKGLFNLQTHPDRCLKKLCKNSLPQSFHSACTP